LFGRRGGNHTHDITGFNAAAPCLYFSDAFGDCSGRRGGNHASGNNSPVAAAPCSARTFHEARAGFS
jgi:hypothetical protein